jgi:hypothetical protein
MTGVLRRQHLVRHLYRLGARAVDELLAELGNAHDISDDILGRLEQYVRIDPHLLAVLGADRIATHPPLMVGDAA